MASQINASNSGFGGIVSTGDSSGVLELQTTGTTAVTIDTSQRVGFVAGTAAAPAITRTGDTNTGIFYPAADTIAFAEGGVEAMRLDASGNVGIGTTNPSPKITVARTATTSVTNASYYLGLGGTENLLDSKRLIGMGYSLGASEEYPTAMGYVETSNAGFTNGAIAFYTRSVTTNTAPSERMRIDSSGNVQIGKTSNSTLSAGINLGSLPNFIASTASPSDGPYIQISNIASSVANGFRYISFRVGSSGNEAGSISTNGSSTVSYVTSSDYRLKDNIVPMTGALATVQSLKPVTYTWKADGTNGQGFIAHELQEVVPDCVTGEKDAVNEDGSIKPQGIDTSFLVATLTAAIQEQQTIINDLKARIEILEAK